VPFVIPIRFAPLTNCSSVIFDLHCFDHHGVQRSTVDRRFILVGRPDVGDDKVDLRIEEGKLL